MNKLNKIIVTILIIVTMMANNLILATGEVTDSDNNDSTSQKSNSSRIVVLDPGHGKSSGSMSDDEKRNSGFVQNSSGDWGEWRHWKDGTSNQSCEETGCTGPNGSTGHWYPIGNGDRDTEPDINLNNANAAKKYLEEMGYTVRMTRTSNNENPSFTNRAAKCYPNDDLTATPDAELYVCIHSNAGGGSGTSYISAEGTYKQAHIPSDYISKSNSAGDIINKKVAAASGLKENSPIGGQGWLIAFNKNPCPTAYLEIGFFDNASDLEILNSKSDEIGKAIAEGVNGYLQGIEPSVNTGSTATGGSSSSNVVEKGKITTTSNEDKFLGLWKNSVGYYVPYYEDPEKAKFNPDGIKVYYEGYGQPVDDILNGQEWMYDLLENKSYAEKTQMYSKLMKYLIYKYTGNLYDNNPEFAEFDFSIFDIESIQSSSSVSSLADIPLYEPTLSREDFIKAMQEFSDAGAKGAKANFDAHFNSRSGDIYDWSVEAQINPELIVVFAWAEQSFNDPIGDESNFWGLAAPNGSSSPSYGNFKNGVKAMGEYFQLYSAGSGSDQENMVKQNAAARQGCNPNGYGQPGTLKGLLSVYTQLLGYSELHYDGDAGGLGGIPYLKTIYGDEFEAKCGSVHTVGVTPWTQEEYADASAYVYEQRRDMWQEIFGKYATIGGSNDIIQVAQECMKWLDDHDCVYILGGGHVPMQEGDRGIDCTRFTSWVLGLCGYMELGTVWTSYDLEGNPGNWPKITNKADLQPGDILVYEGHGDIYVGPGSDGTNENTIKKINAGWETWEEYASTNYIYETGWREGYLFALRPTR